MNLLFIFTDQQNRYALSCMDNPNIETPNLDRLAEKGVLFRRCYSSNPVCGPFRGSLLTGQYTSTCGVLRNNDPLPEGTTTFAESLNQAGYDTSWVGKWHLGDQGNIPIPEKLQGGFNHFIGYQCYNGFYKDVCFYDKEENEYRFDKHRTEVTTDLAVEQLRNLAKNDKSFMLMMSYQAPHYPEQPAPEYEAMYSGSKIIHRKNYQDIAPFTPTFSPYSPRPVEDDSDFQKYGNDLDEYIRLYNAMCTQIDTNVGRLMDELDALGIADDTMIMFSSDHGDMQGSHGLKNKCLPYEESAGIPFIAYVPGMPGAKVSDALVTGIDMMPTCLELLDAEIPESVQGKSFAPLLRGETDEIQDTIFVESNMAGWCMIVKDHWKLAAECQDDGLAPYLMINLQEDPYEMNNRFEDLTVAEKRKELFSELVAWENNIHN